MCPNKIKPGDFLTWVWEDSPGITVGRVISLEKYKVNKSDSLYGKVCAAQMLVFPYWDEDTHTRCNFARVCRFYLEQASYSSEAEITAWMRCAMEHEDNLRKEAADTRQCYRRTIVKSKIVRMEDLDKYDTSRLPPKTYYNWLWSCLKRFKLFNPKTGLVLLLGEKVWKCKPTKGKS